MYAVLAAVTEHSSFLEVKCNQFLIFLNKYSCFKLNHRGIVYQCKLAVFCVRLVCNQFDNNEAAL